MKAFLASALLLSAFASPVAASTVSAELQRTVVDGVDVEYTSTRDAKGALILAGRETDSGRKFRLKVANGWVRGKVDGRPVIFHVSEAERESLASGVRSAGR